jgi:hypothetical protein
MTKIHYIIVKHDGGWTYKLDDVFAETFASHSEAVTAAQRAASRQQLTGESVEIRWEDIGGTWHDERVDGSDRPAVDVIDRQA